jgi:hypothetical protein
MASPRAAYPRKKRGGSHSKLNHTVSAAAQEPLQHISRRKPLESCVAAQRAPDTADHATKHSEIRAFLAGVAPAANIKSLATSMEALRNTASPTW